MEKQTKSYASKGGKSLVQQRGIDYMREIGRRGGLKSGKTRRENNGVQKQGWVNNLDGDV